MRPVFIAFTTRGESRPRFIINLMDLSSITVEDELTGIWRIKMGAGEEYVLEESEFKLTRFKALLEGTKLETLVTFSSNPKSSGVED